MQWVVAGADAEDDSWAGSPSLSPSTPSTPSYLRATGGPANRKLTTLNAAHCPVDQLPLHGALSDRIRKMDSNGCVITLTRHPGLWANPVEWRGAGATGGCTAGGEYQWATVIKSTQHTLSPTLRHECRQWNGTSCRDAAPLTWLPSAHTAHRASACS